MLIDHEVICPCHGIVEKVLREDSSYIHEGEILFVIRNEEDTVPVSVKYSGYVKGIEVQPGEAVIPRMILAYIQEDISIYPMESD